MSNYKQLNLGAGKDIRKNFDNQDYKKFKGIDLNFDIEKYPWPIKTNEYDLILCNHILEHSKDIFKTFNELHRISKSQATIQIEVPHHSTSFAFTQIDHKYYFGLDSLSILEEKDFQNKSKNFEVIKQQILIRGEKSSKLMRFISYPINKLINFNKFTQFIVDRFISKIIPFYFMKYELTVKK
jgi:ubiquinone/menaquinone biosynthesis C-methylase UbiE